MEAYHAAVEQLVARAPAVRPAPIKEQMAEAATQAGKENAARPAPAKAKEARNCLLYTSNLSDLGIDGIKKTFEGSHDPANQKLFEPVCEPVGEKIHKRLP